LTGRAGAAQFRRMRRTIALIACPTLVISGQYDTATLAAHSEQIAAAVRVSNVEYPAEFLRAVLDFLLAVG
jgi:3-oxoadipate enol-lactonase